MLSRSRISTSSPSTAYQAVADDDDDDKDGDQSSNPEVVHDQLISDETSDVDAEDLGVVLTEKDVRDPSPLH
jgi:hypothetical protein